MNRGTGLVLLILATALVVPPTPATAAALMCNGQPATIAGTNGPDALVGTVGIDVIVGRGGADVIHGLGGDDVICGGAGPDLVFGGGGNDWISGGNGDDYLIGRRGGDTVYGGRGLDAINGGRGADMLDGGAHRDAIRGGDRNDRMFGKRGADVIIGGAGNDVATGGDNPDRCKAETTITCEAPDPAVELHDLGIGDQAFGDNTEVALLEFAALLGDPGDEGDPDEDSGWVDSFSPWGTCPGLEVRVVRWGDVEIFNTRESIVEDGEFFTWQISDPLDDREDKRLITAEGLRWEDTVAQIEVIYGARATIEELDPFGFWIFYIDGDPSGVRGTVTGEGEYFDTVALLGGGIGCGE
ncbi:MAG TPA: calcium-binding protein [Acidimicrobiia bacterium]